MLFTGMMLPVLVSIGSAVDYGNAFRVRQHLRAATDASVLAAAQATHLTDSERLDLARTMFDNNYVSVKGARPATYNVRVNEEGRVLAVANADAYTYFLGLAGWQRIPVGVRSSARAVNPKPICLLALNETMDDAVAVSGTGSLEAIDCAVQANSVSEKALYAANGVTAEAEAFCTPGGFVGTSFNPRPKRCYQVEDPYKDLEVPSAGSCHYNNKRVRKQDGAIILLPGVYCGGLEVAVDADAFMLPGRYFMVDGPFSVASQARLKGFGITVFLLGDNTRIDIDGGGEIDLQAPTWGDFEGFLFVQDRDSNPYPPVGQINTINGGGTINLVGTIYLPTQPIRLAGGGTFGLYSPLMPIIADYFRIDGNGVFQVDVDEANMEVRLPMTNEGSVVMN